MKWYDVRAQHNGSNAEIYIYGHIVSEKWFEDEITAKDFIDELGALKNSEIDLHINSPGGNVTAGFAIFAALRRHPQKVTAYIDGVAASMAGVVAMAADEVVMAEHAFVMIHNPWGIALGDANELRKQADYQDKLKAQMMLAYQTRADVSTDELSAMMDEETWLNAEEAIATGFADSVEQQMQSVAAIGDIDLSIFSNLPNSLTPSVISAQKDAENQFSKRLQEIISKQPLPVKRRETKDLVFAQSKEQSSMTDEVATNTTDKKVVDIDAARADAVQGHKQAERQRRDTISAIFAKTNGHDQLLTKCLLDGDCTAQQASERLIEAMAEHNKPVSTHRVESGETEAEKFSTGMQSAILARANMGEDDKSNNYRSFSMMDFARKDLEINAVNIGGLGKREIVSAAFTHSTSNFPNILKNVANKSLLMGWEEQPETYQLWTNRGVLVDYKETSRIDLNAFPSLDKVEAGAEYTYAKLGDRGETITLAKYGKLISLTREAIINDDQDAFSRIPMKAGQAARRTVGNMVYAVLTDNPNMSDGIALFQEANHKNLPATGTALTSESVDTMISRMAKQKDPDGHASALNINLAYLLVPVSLRGKANQVRSSEFSVGASATDQTIANEVRDMFEVVSDARIDVTAGAQPWYGVANPSMHDTIEVAYLDGDDTPFLDDQEGFTTDGTVWKVRIEVGIAPRDFRTLQKNKGV